MIIMSMVGVVVATVTAVVAMVTSVVFVERPVEAREHVEWGEVDAASVVPVIAGGGGRAGG
jgi:hypothetical protein